MSQALPVYVTMYIICVRACKWGDFQKVHVKSVFLIVRCVHFVNHLTRVTRVQACGGTSVSTFKRDQARLL